MKNEFKQLGLSTSIVTSIATLNYDTPSEIQMSLIPLILEGKDLIGQAQTGTGKTLAYAASILSKMDVKTNIVKALILTPTRELALQVSEEFETLNKDSNFSILAVYGGSNIDQQIKSLHKGVDIVVGTPGRVMDLMKRKKLALDNLEFFVLDEADEMLNMGFLEDIETIFKQTNEKKQVLMLSATMPKAIKKLATKYMKEDYEHIAIEQKSKTATSVIQSYYVVNQKVRTEVLCRVLDLKSNARTIIFCQTKKECDELLTELVSRGYHVEAMHGDISQEMRIKTLERFKKGLFNYLIATDVAARGIHVDNIDCVINYDLPQEFESYIHRIGRTGRAGSMGEAISLVNHREVNYLKKIEEFANCQIVKKDLPDILEIKQLKYQSIINRALALDNKEALEYVRDLNKSDLITLSSSLLKLILDQELGSDLEKEIEVKEENKKIAKNTTRYFITIGKKDNVKKGSLLDFLKKESNINKDCFKNIEVLSTFTFIDVDKKVAKDFIKNIKNKKFNNRIIRIEEAKRQK